MSIYMSRLFPKSNSSLSLCRGTAIKSSVLRLREDTFVLDTGVGSPRMCTQDQLTRVPSSTTRFENNVQFVDQSSRESLMKRKSLERFFIDIVAGDAVMKERAASKKKSRNVFSSTLQKT
ncbi:hypothetical protein LIER_43834 [Lithospermum erythrorhizon]|uniref:Uncharacterized protein n=1 Tax=Lithospermum erythrorhizon TaxID=34254 RepID=A0AAV3R0V5_LITER